MKYTDSIDRQWLREYKNQLLAELYIAYLEARRNGKRATANEQKFEANEMENLVMLRDDLLDKTYKPSRGTAHIIHDPVEREIFAAPFRDRIVHHWVYDKIYDWWDRRFIYDSYSCREGKGTLFGIKRLSKMIRSASNNYTRPTWVAKMDIQGYFMSINRKKLYDLVIVNLDKQYTGRTYTHEYELLKFAIGEIIFDDPVRGVKRHGWPEKWKNLPDNKSLFCQEEGFGIVIGNLTSQLFSNIFLDQLDRYIKYTLKYKYYGRYVDDFFIILSEEQLANFKNDVEAIREFLRRMGLTLHPKKFYIQKIERGVQFLGGIVYPHHIDPSKRIKRKFGKAIKTFTADENDIESIVSYLGYTVHLSHYQFNNKIFDLVGWEYDMDRDL